MSLLDMPAPILAPGARRVNQLGIDRNDDDLPKNAPIRVTRPALQPISQEGSMPKGHYDRSKAKPRAKKVDTESKAAAAPAGEQLEQPAEKKRGAPRGPRKARAVKPQRRRASSSSAEVARTFAVWNDGSVEINTDGCKGHLSGEDVKLLVAYVQRLRAGDRA